MKLPWGWNDVKPNVLPGLAAQTRSQGHDDGNLTLEAVIHRLDRTFVAKDTQVLYAVSAVLLAMIWALIITIYRVHDVYAKRDTIVTVFCLVLDAIAFLYAVRRIWILKFDMVHPALEMLGELNYRSASAIMVAPSSTSTSPPPAAYQAAGDTERAPGFSPLLLVGGRGLLRTEAPGFRASGVSMTNFFLGAMVCCQFCAVIGAAAGAACLVGNSSTVAAGIGLAAGSSVAFVLSVVFYRKHAGVHLQHLNNLLWRN